jgi:hypothetical protein
MKKLCRDVQQSLHGDTTATIKILDGITKRLGQLKRKVIS